MAGAYDVLARIRANKLPAQPAGEVANAFATMAGARSAERTAWWWYELTSSRPPPRFVGTRIRACRVPDDRQTHGPRGG